MKKIKSLLSSIKKLSTDEVFEVLDPFSYYNNSIEGAIEHLYWNGEKFDGKRNIHYYKYELLKVYKIIKDNEDELIEVLNSVIYDAFIDYHSEDLDEIEIMGYNWNNIINFFFTGKLNNDMRYTMCIPYIQLDEVRYELWDDIGIDVN